MFDKTDKGKLYWLIYQYLQDKITESVFCDEYYYSNDLGINEETLTDVEKKVFKELSIITSRFSPYEEDYKLDPRAFYNVQQLRQKITETWEVLKCNLQFSRDYFKFLANPAGLFNSKQEKAVRNLLCV